jgi:hypothetical protein
MPKLYEYFGLIFLFYSDDHDPMHLHVQHGDREGIICLSLWKASWWNCVGGPNAVRTC